MQLPSLHGNWVDLIIIIFLALYAFGSYEQGFFALLAQMGSFVGSFVIALKFYSLGANFFIGNFSFPHGIANAVGFIVVALISELVLGYLFNFLYRKIPPKIFESQWNRMLAPIPALVDGIIIVAFFANLIIALPITGRIKFDILRSRIAGYLVTQSERMQGTLGNIFGGAAQETLNFLTVSPQSKESINLNFTTTTYSIDETDEVSMLVLVNQERTNRGLSSLTMDAKLRSVARAHSADMFTKGYFSHVAPDGSSPFDRMKAAGITFNYAGENIAYAPTLTLAHNGLMNSPEHRDNILSTNFRKIGIGIVDGGIYGKMFTQDFTD